jgi:hypothetical protein
MYRSTHKFCILCNLVIILAFSYVADTYNVSFFYKDNRATVNLLHTARIFSCISVSIRHTVRTVQVEVL